MTVRSQVSFHRTNDPMVTIEVIDLKHVIPIYGKKSILVDSQVSDHCP